MAKIYAKWVRNGVKTIEDVPALWREEVKKILGGKS